MLAFTSINKQEMLNCLYSKRLLEKLHLINLDLSRNSKIDIMEIETAIIYARYYHGDQKRDSGESYYSHPLEVAHMVSDYLPRTDIIVTAILHDTLEDTALTKEEIEETFGAKIAEQVYGLTRVKEDGVKISSAKMVEELWISKKSDLIVIKLFDRIHNMQTIASKSPEKIKKIMEETIKSFLVLCPHLDILEIEEKLISLCDKNSITQKQSNDLFFQKDNDLLISLGFQNVVCRIQSRTKLE